MARVIMGRRNNNEPYTLMYCKIKNSVNYAVCGIEIHDGFNGEVRIPSAFIDDHDGTFHETVVRIEANAFKGKTEIKSVTIPGSVTKIGDAAFEGTGLVSTPWGVDRMGLTLGKFVFHNCACLKTARMPVDARKISDGTFDGCDSLTTVTFGGGLESIGNSAFRGCRRLTVLEFNFIFRLPDSVTKIGDMAFEGCTGLTAVPWSTSSGLKSIGNFAFRGCHLTWTTIPAHVTEIGVGSFQGCGRLQGISGMGGVRYIGYRAFYNDVPGGGDLRIP